MIQPFEKYQELCDSIAHAATFWKTDSQWSHHLHCINEVITKLEGQSQQSGMRWRSAETDMPTTEGKYCIKVSGGYMTAYAHKMARYMVFRDNANNGIKHKGVLWLDQSGDHT